MTFVDEVLSDPANWLTTIVEEFLHSERPCWHIDRHVVDILEDGELRPCTTEAANAAALALARRWSADRSGLRPPPFVADPVVIIDDAWLDRASGAPPPSVYTCIARSEDGLRPSYPRGTLPVPGNRSDHLDLVLRDGEELRRSRDTGLHETRAWMIVVPR